MADEPYAPTDTYLKHTQEQWDRRVAKLAQSFHDIADKIVMLGDPEYMKGLRTGRPDYFQAASRIQKEITWALANAGAWYLIDDAKEAEGAQRQADEEEKARG